MLLGASSSKPTEVYSNGSWIAGLNVGQLTKKFKEQNTRLQTTRVSPRYGTILNGLICQIGPSGRYTNKAGQCKFTGTAGLKQSASRS